MKFKLFRENGALNSTAVFDAFSTGLKHLGHEEHEDFDVAVIWSVLWHGRMKNNQPVWEYCQKNNIPVIVLEVGGIKRGTTWKVGINGINRDAFFGPSSNDSSRARQLGLELKPWSFGEHIVICGQHDKSHQWRDMPPMSKWISDVIDEIRKYSERKIYFRPHPRCQLPGIEHEFKNVFRQIPLHVTGTYDDFDFSFKGAHAVVSWTSNPGIQSIIGGVPAFVGQSSLAYDVANHSFDTIEDPIKPERQQWLNDYAHTEWTVDEIAEGLPLARLLPKLNELLVDKTV